MSTTFTPAATIAGAWCALTLCGSASSATSAPRAASAGGTFSKRKPAAAGQRRVHGAQRLADVVDRDHADELDLGMDQQAPDELRAAVSGAADDDGLESLHLRNCTFGPE